MMRRIRPEMGIGSHFAASVCSTGVAKSHLTKFARFFRCVADAAQTIVVFERMGIELFAIAE